MRKKLVIVLLAGVAVILIIIGLHGHSSKTAPPKAEDISTSFINKVIDGDAAGSYALYSKDTQTSTPLLDWAATVGSLSTTFKGQTSSLQETDKGSSNLLLVYTIHGSDGLYDLSVLVAPQGSGWVIQSFNSVLQD